jgi:hypothetical protein
MDIRRLERRPRAHMETLDAPEVVSGSLHQGYSLRGLRTWGTLRRTPHASFIALDPAPAIGERYLIPSHPAAQSPMQFDTKIAVVIRTDLEPWQKLNVASFLAGGIAASFPECIGENYADGSGTKYLSLIGQPILIYGADRPALTRALERALARNVVPAVYTEEMFKTTHDAANREVVRAVIRAELNLVGLAMRAERKVIDKIVDGLKFHS